MLKLYEKKTNHKKETVLLFYCSQSVHLFLFTIQHFRWNKSQILSIAIGLINRWFVVISLAEHECSIEFVVVIFFSLRCLLLDRWYAGNVGKPRPIWVFNDDVRALPAVPSLARLGHWPPNWLITEIHWFNISLMVWTINKWSDKFNKITANITRCFIRCTYFASISQCKRHSNLILWFGFVCWIFLQMICVTYRPCGSGRWVEKLQTNCIPSIEHTNCFDNRIWMGTERFWPYRCKEISLAFRRVLLVPTFCTVFLFPFKFWSPVGYEWTEYFSEFTKLIKCMRIKVIFDYENWKKKSIVFTLEKSKCYAIIL